MASISTRQRADGTTAYRVQFRAHKGGPPTTETFDTADQAAYFADLVDRIGGEAARAKRDQAARTSAPSLKAVLEDFVAQAPDLTPGTAGEYRRVLARSGIESTLGTLPVDLITKTDVEAWVKTRTQTPSERTGKPPSPKTLRNEHGLLSTLLAHAVARRWCETNVAKGVRLPKRERAELEILTDDEFLRLHAEMTDRYKPLVWLMAATGLRWGEATALQWRHIGETTIRVQQAWKHDEQHGRVLGPPKTAKGWRTVETTAAVIASLGERGKPDAWVFTNTRGKPILHNTFAQSHWGPACKRAKLEPQPKVHGLRHFAASHMLAQGADILEVSRALGHESVKTSSDVYGHLVPSRTRPTAVHAAHLQALIDKQQITA